MRYSESSSRLVPLRRSAGVGSCPAPLVADSLVEGVLLMVSSLRYRAGLGAAEVMADAKRQSVSAGSNSQLGLTFSSFAELRTISSSPI